MAELKNCPFCGREPTITEHMPKIHGEPQWQIGCEEDFCLISPGAYGFGSKEQAIKAWNSRTPDKLINVVYEGTSPEAMLILEEDEPETKWCKIHNEPYLYGCHRCHNDSIGA